MSPNISDIMQLIISHFWIVLLTTNIFGILVGFMVRGILAKSRIRKAQVERDVAETELAQTREELDALYAAQRKRQSEAATAVSGTSELSSQLQDREQHIKQLSDQLSQARSELERLQSQSAASMGDPAPAESDTDVAAGIASAAASQELMDRNAWLESRIAELEAGIESRPTAPDPEAIAAAGALEEELAKLRWRNRYLEGRLAYYEESRSESAEAESQDGGVSAEAAPEAANEDTPDHIASDVAPVEQDLSETLSEDPQDELAEEQTDPDEAPEEELAAEDTEHAADIEEDDTPADIEATEDDTLIPDFDEGYVEPDDDAADFMTDVEEHDAPDMPDDEEMLAAYGDEEPDDPVVEVITTVSDESEAEEIAAAAEEADDDFEADDADDDFEADDLDEAEEVDDTGEQAPPHPSDAVLAALDEEALNGGTRIEPVQPPVIEKPDGATDDLTAIGGIGPRIEEVLHGLGIWSYEQIANWGPEHTAWIEQHLSFQGRIEREDWIGQARALIN